MSALVIGILTLFQLVLSDCVWGAFQTGDAESSTDDSHHLIKKSRDVQKLRPQYETKILLEKSEQAIQDGFDFLVKSQNSDGSWGSHHPKITSLKDFGFGTINRGSQDAVRTACTAICAEALLFQPQRTEPQQKALEKAINELLKVRKFGYHPGESFNTWGYGYKLGFLVQLAQSDLGAAYRSEIGPAAQSCVDGLLRHQQHGGGWGYYSGALRDFQSMSFNSSFFGLSLHRSQKLGLKIPAGMIQDVALAVRRQRVGDGSYVYSSEQETRASSVLANLGAGSRTVASTLALYEMGIVDEREVGKALQVFENGENYLEQGRKLIQPHSAVHQISGYFFFFGYNYASELAAALETGVTVERWDRFAWTMLRTQEKNGSWWDTPAADYGDKWGTGFAIRTLQRYLEKTPKLISETAKGSTK